MNVELLGNGDAHVHFHIFPRVPGDIKTPGPVWWVPRDEMFSDEFKPTKEKLIYLKQVLKAELDLTLKKYILAK